MLTSPFALAVALLASAVSASPNFIVMQPDDFQFYEEWTPPAHVAVYKKAGKGEYHFPSSGFPNIEYLRSNGVQMMQANAASPMCGTSRYSTVTGRYASRSSWGRDINIGLDVGEITIPNTKLTDTSSVEDGDDCSANNLAQVMKGAGYKTGMVGKWHLTKYTQRLYSYNTVQENVKECGFDYAEALYAENLNSGVYDGTFSHNMEYVAEHAVDFIKESGSDPFFLYFNPTVPHASGDVYEALTSFTCLDTPEGTLTVEPVVTGMTAEYSDCASYRQSVIDRGEGDTSNEVLGSIWVDDSVGALIAALTETGQLENTFFLFM